MQTFDIVKIGDATLYHADCREVLPTLGKFDLLLTDPPYGVNYKGSSTKHAKADGVGYLSFDDSEERVRAEIVPSVIDALSLCNRAVITPGINCSRYYPKPDAEGVIWYPSGANSGRWGFVTHQPIFYYGKCPFLASGRGSRPTGFQSTEPAEKNGHPCPKPIGQVAWMLNRGSFTGETVLDPFMGSGTTGVACAQSGRSFTGIERERKYFDIACERIERAYAQGKLFAPEIVKPQQAEIAA